MRKHSTGVFSSAGSTDELISNVCGSTFARPWVPTQIEPSAASAKDCTSRNVCVPPRRR